MLIPFSRYTMRPTAQSCIRVIGFALKLIALIAAISFAIEPSTAAQNTVSTVRAASATGRIVISGTVPDEATKASLLGRLRDVYGTAQVDDQISVGNVSAPPDWGIVVPKLMMQQLKYISKGQITVDGTTISLRGEVGNESLRQQVASDFARVMNSSYVVRNGLRVTAQGQALLDHALASRIIEFEPGSALLADSGKQILDDMTEALKKLDTTGFEVIGHTDDTGMPARNLALSRSRADSVRTYLVAKGIRPELIGISGMGADQPIAPNTTDEGRKRNRRIEFRARQ